MVLLWELYLAIYYGLDAWTVAYSEDKSLMDGNLVTGARVPTSWEHWMVPSIIGYL